MSEPAVEDRDTGDPSDPADATETHACPECGDEFQSKVRLGIHRRSAHGVIGGRAGRKQRAADASPEREPKDDRGRQGRRKREVAGTLRELADLAADFRGRDGGSDLPEHLADLIRRDADPIATSIAAIAEKLTPLGTIVDWTCGRGGLLTIATGFSGLLRWLLRSGRNRNAQSAEQQQMQIQYDALVESGLSAEDALAQVNSDWGIG